MDFTEFHNYIYEEFNLNLNAYKQEQLNRRITSLMTRRGIKNLKEYKDILFNNKDEKERFLDFITINVTEFFRNPELFVELKKIIKDYSNNTNNLKIWSAACSIGCEPYSIAMLLDEINPKIKANILATDIDSNILKRASLGEYVETEMKNIDDNFRNKYFKYNNDRYYIDNNIKKSVIFKKHDLILDRYEENFDLIVCRNVVIYFKSDVKKEIFKKFSNSLKVGGLLFVGATESIYNYKEFNLEKLSTFIYKRI